METIRFKGIVSGDGESFCFDVDRETFRRITNREPEDWDDYQNGEFDGLMFVPEDPNKCRLYPNDLFGSSSDTIEVELKIKTI